MKEKNIRSILWIITFALVMEFFVFFDVVNAEAEKRIALSKKNVTINVGKSTTIWIKNVKSKKIKKITWKSSTKKIAKVSKKGKTKARIKGVSVGKCKVRCVALIGGKKYKLSCTVKIRKVKNPIKSKSKIQSHENKKDEIQDGPLFIGFKTLEGKEILDESKSVQLVQAESFIKKDYDSGINNITNKDEIIALKLSYENEKRDNIVEIVLNDSDYGKNQIYTTSSSVNRIISSDTYYSNERKKYITDVTLVMPITKATRERKIEIEETCFLRETVGVNGYVDMSKSRKRSVTFVVPEKTIPSSIKYFEFAENDNGYSLISVNSDYALPKILYIPPLYKEKPVIQISTSALEKLSVDTLIIPDSVNVIENNMGGGSFRAKNIVFLSNTPPVADDLGVKKEGLRIIVPEASAIKYSSEWWDKYADCLFYDDNGDIKEIREISATMEDYIIDPIEMRANNTIDTDGVVIEKGVDENGDHYYQCKFNHSGRFFFIELPQSINLNLYKSVEIKAYATSQMLFEAYSEELKEAMGKVDEFGNPLKWWDSEDFGPSVYTYPFYLGTHSIRADHNIYDSEELKKWKSGGFKDFNIDENGNQYIPKGSPFGENGIETGVFPIEDMSINRNNSLAKIKYLRFGASRLRDDDDENKFNIYTIRFIAK